MRCDPRMESKLPASCSIWYLLQVSHRKPSSQDSQLTLSRSKLFGNERFKPRYGEFSCAYFCTRLLTQQQLSNLPKRQQTSRLLSTMSFFASRPYLMSTTSPISFNPSSPPQHTCILVNTTHALGVERQLEERFPKNVVLSLVSGADIVQLGSSEFEHSGATEVWVGPANKNSSIPEVIQNDMSEALAMTLTTGKVDCKVSPNIRQQQYERMTGYGQLRSMSNQMLT